jgi:hypothetical protein
MCPVCKIFNRIQQLIAIGDDLILMWVPQPLYQFSYPGEPEYISARCERCYDKAIRKKDKKHGRE